MSELNAKKYPITFDGIAQWYSWFAPCWVHRKKNFLIGSRSIS